MVPGEWINYTVRINTTGKYNVGMMFTASGDGGIGLLLDGKAITQEIMIPSTRNENETIPWTSGIIGTVLIRWLRYNYKRVFMCLRYKRSPMGI